MRTAGPIQFLFCLVFGCCISLPLFAVAQELNSIANANTDVAVNARFFAAHGRKALISGSTGKGLEVWAYPFQVVRDYRVSFRVHGAASFVPGDTVLARVEYHPESIVRVYLGPGFVVHETLFVPLDESGAILSYQVQSRTPVEIAVHAQPVLDLMWPASLGGQSISWNDELHAFRISEPLHGWGALIGSPQTTAHDTLSNRTQGGAFAQGMGLVLNPDAGGQAAVFLALQAPGAVNKDAGYRKLIRERTQLEHKSAAHADTFSAQVLRITTPDAQVNTALARAETALDQSWVCSPELGCGLVAGYGPARDARRPQYDWFFAGDGMIGAGALLSMGDMTGARRELEFVLRYQDAKTGMIWHEISQSAPLVDWVHAYPYMYVHVDITFQFLEAAARYALVSGDVDFVRGHWKEIDSAYRFCRALLDPRDGLPRIPSDKQGSNEQERQTDELSLSSAWIAAADGYAQLSAIAGHEDRKAEAEQAAQRARATIPGRYWDAQRQFLISGYTAAGASSLERRSAAADPAVLELLKPAQKNAVLDELSSSDFQTDWGTRGISSNSPNYQPDSYAQGSVFALSTADTAAALWIEHRPLAAYQTWRALVPWSSLDSIGHMHEVLAGDVYRPGAESVPEQMWSSAAFVDATVRGLLGLEVDAAHRRVSFAPHLPAEWNTITLDHVRLGADELALHLQRVPSGLVLSVDNPGAAIRLDYSPQVPLGAKIVRAQVNHAPLAATLVARDEDAHVSVSLELPHGHSETMLELRGGIDVVVPVVSPVLGEASAGLRIVSVRQTGNQLALIVDHRAGRTAELRLHTGEWIGKVAGASLQYENEKDILLTIAPDAGTVRTGDYLRATITVELATRN